MSMGGGGGHGGEGEEGLTWSRRGNHSDRGRSFAGFVPDPIVTYFNNERYITAHHNNQLYLSIGNVLERVWTQEIQKLHAA